MATAMNLEERRPEAPDTEGVMCAKHCVPLEPGKIELTYQGHTFPVDMLCCPVCGEMWIPEDVAKGKMLEVEQTLEEK
jgi:hypothetical protein